MKKLYRVTFEAELVFASDSEDFVQIREEVMDVLAEDHSMRDELEAADITGITRLYKSTATTDELASLPWGTDDDEDVATILAQQPDDPKASQMLDDLKLLRKKFQGGMLVDEGPDLKVVNDDGKADKP